MQMISQTPNKHFSSHRRFYLLTISTSILLNSIVQVGYAQEPITQQFKQRVYDLLAPSENQDFRVLNISKNASLNVTSEQTTTNTPPQTESIINLDFYHAIQRAIQQHPELSQIGAMIAAQNANIDVAKSAYYPQISGGVETADLTSGERGRQLLKLNASQMLYDFGKVKNSVNKQETELYLQQAQLLLKLDEIALETANTIINVKRYQELSQSAQEQLDGLKNIANIASLRAKAGISSQADPVQAQSYVESAESSLIEQETLLAQYQSRLNILLSQNVNALQWQIPKTLITDSQLYTAPEYNKVPQVISAQLEIERAKFDKKSTTLSRYPTINVVGSASQSLNGKNPNNNQDNGLYSSIMLEANSNFFQGGAISAQTRAASHAEEAAKAKLQAAYRDIQEQIKLSEEQIAHKQRQIAVLSARQSTTIRTRELYQEQYKLGTRSVVDLLNAEQAIHTANMALIAARYDIYSSLVQYISVTGRSRNVYGLNNISIQGFEIQQ